MDPIPSVLARAGSGLVGNANQGGRRQVTLLSMEAWQSAERELRCSLDPRLRRANLLLSGIELAETRGQILAIGRTQILIHGETKPCNLMEESHPGLRSALAPDWRGGAYGEVLTDGEIRVGDSVAWIEPEVFASTD